VAFHNEAFFSVDRKCRFSYSGNATRILNIRP
jgi:hypothetical protein